MRDFNSGDIQGNITINNNSNNISHKLLIHCNNQELLHEEQHRVKILRKEKSRKNVHLFKILAFSASLILIATLWFYIQGRMDTVSYMVGAAGAIVGLAGLSKNSKPTEFELRQQSALNEIQLLLRERDIR